MAFFHDEKGRLLGTFRPTGSTTAAIITLLNTVTDLLQSNPYVVVICLDFSKAFDTVRHSTLLAKMTELDFPVPVYNWIVDFFEDTPIEQYSTVRNRLRSAYPPA